MGTLCRLNEGMPIRVGAEQPTPRPALPAPTPPTATSTEIAMVDVSMLPEAGDEQVIHTQAVPANQMTIAQQRMAQAVWQSIQLAIIIIIFHFMLAAYRLWQINIHYLGV